MKKTIAWLLAAVLLALLAACSGQGSTQHIDAPYYFPSLCAAELDTLVRITVRGYDSLKDVAFDQFTWREPLA